MINYTKVFSTEINALKQRIVKVLRFGKFDVQTPVEASPYGFDSNPIKGMIAIYAPTTDKGETVIIGYLNKNQKAGVGELRTFATDATGAEKFYTWIKNDGTYEIGGNSNNAVKFNELKAEFNKLKDSHNSFLSEYQLHTHPYVNVSTPATTSPTVSTEQPNTSNIDASKNDKIKTI